MCNDNESAGVKPGANKPDEGIQGLERRRSDRRSGKRLSRDSLTYERREGEARKRERRSMERRAHDRRSNDPLWWWGSARDLYISAGVLWFSARGGADWKHKQWNVDVVRYASSAPFLMLYGMALEALLKAICFKKGVKPRETHKLAKLSEMAGVDMTETEARVLEILSNHIEWAGRYPAPKQPKKNKATGVRGTGQRLKTEIDELGEVLRALLSDDVETALDTQTTSCVPTRVDDHLSWDYLNPIWGKFYLVFYVLSQSNE